MLSFNQRKKFKEVNDKLKLFSSEDRDDILRGSKELFDKFYDNIQDQKKTSVYNTKYYCICEEDLYKLFVLSYYDLIYPHLTKLNTCIDDLGDNNA